VTSAGEPGNRDNPPVPGGGEATAAAGTPTRPAGSPPAESPLLRACRGLDVPHTPVWFMRQAGRSLPEYRALREGTSMLEACSRPDMITEITLQPVRRYGTDAAIFFSDIVLPLRAVGVEVEIEAGVGPVMAKPVETMADVEAIQPLEPGAVGFVTEAVQTLVGELGGTPLIGFAGAPFTLASYLVEGGPSRDHARTKAMMHGAPHVWHALAEKLAGISAAFLQVQVSAGASAVQLFDSWAGALAPDDYTEFVQPHSRRVLETIGATGVPRIHFGVGTGELLALMGEAGADVVGVDWRVPLDEAARRLGGRYAVQGNLDPTLVFAPWPVVEAKVRDVLRRGRAAPGHVFNLGHGVLPTSDPAVLRRIVDLVHEVSAAARATAPSGQSADG
jgi:uroporphyrinogen decarboxylase